MPRPVRVSARGRGFKKDLFMKYYLTLCCVFLEAAVFCSTVSAHGVRGKIFTGTTHVAMAVFDDGEPFAWASVEVFSPNGELFQSGTTDASGRFAFVPETPGLWRAVLKDGMGHQIALTQEISMEKEAITPQKNADAPDIHDFKISVRDRLYEKLTLGFSLIFGCFGIIAMIRAKKPNNSNNRQWLP